MLINYTVGAKQQAAAKRLKEVRLGPEINVVTWALK